MEEAIANGSTKAQSYIVRPQIDSEKQEIRTIELLPGAGHDLIVAKFLVTSLNDACCYEPLSYAWGDPDITFSIMVDGKSCQVTTNLYKALRNLRKPSESRIMWVDALCINQQDALEKSQQVSMMGDIYAGADNCLAWLGDFLDNNLSLSEAEATLGVIQMIADGKKPYSAVESDVIAEGIGAIVNSEWWQRYWTIQEAVLPSEITVVWGSLSIVWGSFPSAANRLLYDKSIRSLVREDPYLTRAFAGIRFVGPVNSIERLRQSWRGLYTMTAVTIFRELGETRTCSDPRDKVYAIATLLSKQLLTKIDYSLTTSQLYRKTTLAIIQTTRDLECCIGIRGRKGPTKDLPTWAVDWNGTIEWFFVHRHRYNTARADAGRKMEIYVNAQETVLSLTGVLVDRVKTVGAANSGDTGFDRAYPTEEVQACVRRWFEVARSHFEQRSDSTNSTKDWRESFWRAICGNEVTANQRPVTTEDIPLFENYRTEEHLDHNMALEVYSSLNNNVFDQCFFITERGYMGTGPPNMKTGDEVWVLCGGKVPFLLRPLDPSQHQQITKASSFPIDYTQRYQLLGDVFVQGIMQGEAVTGHVGDLSFVHLI